MMRGQEQRREDDRAGIHEPEEGAERRSAVPSVRSSDAPMKIAWIR